MFWVLLVWGWDELWPDTAITFVSLWILAYAFCWFMASASLWFMPWVAVLDVALYVVLLVKRSV